MTTRESNELTPFEIQLEGESRERFWEKEGFLNRIFETTVKYLKLKPTNSVRIILQLHLEEPLAGKYPLGSPAVVRMRISRVAAPEGRLRFEWRLASATTEEIESQAEAWHIEDPFAGSEKGSPMAFLGKQFGKGTGRFRWHYPHVSKIDAQVAFREPLGVLAVMEGSSTKVLNSPGGVMDCNQCLSRVFDHPALLEP